MTEQWLNIKASDVWTNWYPGGILEGMWLKSGLLDSSPQLTYAQRFVNLTRLRSSGRTVHVGATSLDRSEFMLFNQTDDNFPRAVLASSAIPGIFPVVEIAGDHFVDGGIE
jgi:NTE family protein